MGALNFNSFLNFSAIKNSSPINCNFWKTNFQKHFLEQVKIEGSCPHPCHDDAESANQRFASFSFLDFLHQQTLHCNVITFISALLTAKSYWQCLCCVAFVNRHDCVTVYVHCNNDMQRWQKVLEEQKTMPRLTHVLGWSWLALSKSSFPKWHVRSPVAVSQPEFSSLIKCLSVGSL